MPRLTYVHALCCLLLSTTVVFGGPRAMTIEEARHLLSRTGFGAAPPEITALAGQSYERGVDQILATLHTAPVTSMPAWVDMWAYPQEFVWQLGQTEAELYFTNRWLEIEELSAWWMTEMIVTPSPLTERLVVFWHDHFATSFEVSENAQWMAKQNRFFRQHAAGRFADLAHGILQDPAMLDYLSNTSNVADAPNENLAREFFELFTLGENRGYDQDDIRIAARALTGHTVTEYGAPEFFLDIETHDAGAKTLFGETGPLLGADVVDLTLSHPEFGPYIVEKLWLEFISDQPDREEVARLTAIWRANDFQMQPLLRAMLLSDAFWDPHNRGRLIKSPVDLLVGTIRTLGRPVADARSLVWASGDLGQSLFMPPNVGGWPQGIGWINDASASGRATALTYLLGADMPSDGAAKMRMMTPMQPSFGKAGPEDLRIGQTFVTYVHQEGTEFGAAIILYDVGFAGRSWRSLTLWLAHDADEDFTGLYINTADCAPECFATVPTAEDDPQWVRFETWDGFLDQHPPINATDMHLLQAVTQHLPELAKTTAGHRVWQPDDPAFDAVPDIGQLIAVTQILAQGSKRHLGPYEAKLVQAQSYPNVLGLAGLDAIDGTGDIDDYVAAREETFAIAAVPRVSYASARAWLNALPGDAPDSQRAAQFLMALPPQSPGMREEKFARDADALLRRLVLSPAFQVK